MHTLWSRNRRLEVRAQEIFNIDRAIEREGVASLSLDELKWVNNKMNGTRLCAS